jgi:protein TonB
VLSAAAAPAPAEFSVPPSSPVVALPDSSAPVAPVDRLAPTSAAPAASAPPPEPAAAPRQIPASSIDYLERPAPVYPRASIRLNESGVVVVRVFIDPAGLPRRVELARSSGHPRLDEAAVSGVQQARFKPPTENGLPISGWARIEIPFELER